MKRTVAVFSVIVGAFSLLFLRIFSLMYNNDFVEASSRQSTYSLDVYKNRGTIYDCNLNRLVNDEKALLAAVLPNSGTFDALNGHVKSKSELVEKLEDGEPFVIEVDTADIDCRGVNIFEGRNRYSENQIARHVIGYINSDKEGVSGAEYAFDDFLTENAQSVNIRYQKNAVGQVVDADDSYNLITKNDGDAGVVLTIDEKIQTIAETAAKKLIERGAVVVMDVNNGDIKALVSLPDYSVDDISKYLNDENSPLLNRALSAYNVGSTFKICTSAAALENGFNYSKNYVCTGSIDIDGQVFHCHNRSGHGEVDMERATKVSCNPYFINTAMSIPKYDIAAMASKMGFGRENELLNGKIKGAAGSLPDMDDLNNPADLANFSFGQGKLTATPIQIAQMISSVANGGKSVTARLMMGFTDNAEDITDKVEENETNTIMSEKTAQIIRNNMIATVESGSGTKAIPLYGKAGGKTASAQTGIFDENGKEKVQAWFAGFYPAQSPQYAIVVLNEEMDSGGDYAAPVFKDICDGLYRLGFVK